MKTSLRQRMSWLHTWCGLVCAWLLFLIFLAGSISVFRDPITRWMATEPTLPAATTQLNQQAVLSAAVRFLGQQDANARFWRIELPSDDNQALRVVWRTNTGQTNEVAIDPRNGDVLPHPWGRKTEGGRHFMTLHYTLYGGSFGFWLVGWLTVGMLVALLTGVVVHKRIFKDFFIFRPGRGQRAWLDGHNASAVLTLPFQLMIAFTGLAIFYTTYMPGPLTAMYGEKGYALWQSELADATAINKARALPPRPAFVSDIPIREQLAVVLTAAEDTLGSPARMIMVERPGQPTERISVYARTDREASVRQLSVPAGRVSFQASTGDFAFVHLPQLQPPADPAHDVLKQLHLADFGGWTVKWLYFFCGLIGALMMASGAILFTTKRRNKTSGECGAWTPTFYRIVESINVAAIAGASLACIAYFHANRWVCASLAGRDNWEIRIFFVVWALTLLHALWRPRQKAWFEQFACTAVLCLTLPISNLLTTGQYGLDYARTDDWEAALVEWTIVVLGGVLAVVAWRLQRGTWAPAKAGRLPVAEPGYRWRVLGLVVCAVIGGYVLSSVAAIVVAQALTVSSMTTRAQAVVITTLSAFLAYALIAMWIFGSRRAWIKVLFAMLLLMPITWTLGAA